VQREAELVPNEVDDKVLVGDTDRETVAVPQPDAGTDGVTVDDTLVVLLGDAHIDPLPVVLNDAVTVWVPDVDAVAQKVAKLVSDGVTIGELVAAAVGEIDGVLQLETDADAVLPDDALIVVLGDAENESTPDLPDDTDVECDGVVDADVETVEDRVPVDVADDEPVDVAEGDSVDVLQPDTEDDAVVRGDALAVLLNDGEGDGPPVALADTDTVSSAVGDDDAHTVAESVPFSVEVTELVVVADAETVPLAFAEAEGDTERVIVSDPVRDTDAHRVELLHWLCDDDVAGDALELGVVDAKDADAAAVPVSVCDFVDAPDSHADWDTDPENDAVCDGLDVSLADDDSDCVAEDDADHDGDAEKDPHFEIASGLP
jgi:hypothetical protein